jgi:thiamine kinase-like enzyme
MTGATRDVAHAAAGLGACLQEALAGQSIQLVGHERLKENVHRARVDVDGAERSVIVKWSDPVVARRCGLVARRWLPAVGLEELGAPLLAVVAQPDGEGTWQVYEDLRGRPLRTTRPVAEEVDAVVDAIARVHTSFADHPLLPECRLGGGDRGIHFYSANLRDAVVALRSLHLDGGGAIAVRAALLDRIDDLQKQESDRAQAFAAAGPDTLLHGDLWPTNAVVLVDGEGVRVRLVDWDEVGVGPIGYDLSTLLLRFDLSHRRAILDAYGEAVGRLAGWALPPEQDLCVIFETAAQARLASLLVWSVAAAAEGESDWLPERLASIVEWLDAVHPVLPAR